MCRNIKTLFNFDPPATDAEIQEASLQFVRKIAGFRNPSKTNEQAFEEGVQKIASDIKALLDSLTTTAPPRNREAEAKRAQARAIKRFGPKP